ncbi:MAG TPA: TIGR04283 family arsenosugar biosynthesis glycosyltransferase [Candidatus Acidoferrum sp.]|nr:TIGR04283 family arsenosugar biosynthesis glycosyltransferase [Candidatus Acidoferrum sp.]
MNAVDQQKLRAPRSLSVVIPTRNEELALPETIRRIRANPEVMEIIIADAASLDRTRDVAAELGCRVIASQPGRGTQMRAGAEAAVGDAVLLLHADTWLPPHAAREALDCLSDPRVAAGGYWKEFRDAPLLLRGSKWKCGIRLHLGRRIAGDQGLFMRRQVLERIGGVPDVPLMEEFELCKRLRKIGRLALADAIVLTSARRFMERGVLRTYALMWRIMLQYYLGSSPESLRRLYER